jgi:hypothetical protein
VLHEAAANTESFLKDWKSGNAKDPMKYLHNFCK